MEIIVGEYPKNTSVNTDEQSVVVSADKGDRVVLVLGVNRVQVEYIDGSWTIRHGANIKVKLLPQSDPPAFAPVDANAGELNIRPR